MVRLRFEGALMMSTVLVLLVCKMWVAWPSSVGAALVGLLVEASILWLAWYAAERDSRRALSVGRWLFYPIVYGFLICSASHAYFFESAAERRFSLFEVGPEGIQYFFAHVLPLRGYLVLGGAFVVATGLAMVLEPTPVPRQLNRWPVYTLLFLGAAIGLVLVPRAPSPLVDAGADIYERLSTKTVKAATGKPKLSLAPLDHSQADPRTTTLTTPFKKVVVLVMETMTFANMERERSKLGQSTFVNSALAHTHRYDRYFPNNQDSRTGMLGMLSSRFVPHEAYTEQGRDQYMFLGKQSSLVEHMNQLGYRSAFAVSQNELELVVSDLPWNETLHLDDTKLAKAREQGLLCFVPYEFEHSCEDRALLPEVLAFLDDNERAFVYQEFIWGHSSAYNDASHKTNTAYYSAYVDSLVEHLKQRGTLDETLIVLTSDHGFRDTAQQVDLSVYRIPLWFYATRFAPAVDGRLFSHLNFEELLHRERSLSEYAVEESPYVMIIGPTGASLLTVLTQARDFTLLKLRGDQAALLRHVRLDANNAVVGPARSQATPGDYLQTFQAYRSRFGKGATVH